MSCYFEGSVVFGSVYFGCWRYIKFRVSCSNFIPCMFGVIKFVVCRFCFGILIFCRLGSVRVRFGVVRSGICWVGFVRFCFIGSGAV